ncbi:MAG: phenylalanine--tRNA ligase subunit beta [Candidatus Omnitrophica bacterium]|jgi:phenylalanyl-tRNA synthetase beta chain|nr:phenylalanine--tRNA ligase subunit beta [Candidatus Omnitrophota bacterium]
MKLIYNWLKDFVGIKTSPLELARRLTMAGLEVKAVEEKDGDFVFEIEITSNRPDWLSVIGVAREAAAVTNSKLKIKNEKIKIQKPKENQGVKITIEDKKDCSLYTAKIIKGVSVGVSPEWLKKRLELIGCRSINNVVDITNYAMFTYGEPLHAFDADKLASYEIEVRRANAGEQLVTIDGVFRKLDKDILVIADKQQAQAVAGIMGGKSTEVTASTRNILLEAAIFDPVLIRRARRKLGMQTDSSYRFERGIDTQTALVSSDYAARMIIQLAGGNLICAREKGATKILKKTISVNYSSVQRILGASISPALMKNILAALGFGVKGSKTCFSVTVPSARQDVEEEVDLIEEIARIFGIENIPAEVPYVKPQPRARTRFDIISKTKNILIAQGVNEAITYTLIDRKLLELFSWPVDEAARLVNPLSEEQEFLRPCIIASLVRAAALNLKQKQPLVELFEVGKIYTAGNNEELVLGLVLCGKKSVVTQEAVVNIKEGFLRLKGIIQNLFSGLGIAQPEILFNETTAGFKVKLNSKEIGQFVKVSSAALEAMDVKYQEVYAAQISLEEILMQALPEKKFVPVSIFPAICRDISFVVQENISFKQITDLAHKTAGLLLEQVKITDIYRGKQIPQGCKNFTVSCVYRLPNRTLTDLEVSPIHACVVQALTQALSAQIR